MSEQAPSPATPEPAPLLTPEERERAFAMFGGNRKLRRKLKAQRERAAAISAVMGDIGKELP